MSTSVLAFGLGIVGALGIIVLLTLTGLIYWRYQGYPQGSFRWHLRNLHLKHVSVLASLFFFAMAASYAVLGEAWAILYLIIALKTGLWWLRMTLEQHS